MFILKRYLPEFVYGSVDGVITTVAVITGAIGIGLSAQVIFILGLANVLADGFSMGSSKYLSSISYDQLTKTVGIDTNPKKKSLVTFFSFVFLGFIPLIPFLLSIFIPFFREVDIFISLVLSVICFAFVGYIGAILTNTSHIRNVIRTIIVGSIAASISYIIGYVLNILM